MKNFFGKIKKFIICFLNIHKWNYDKKTCVKWNKTCEYCGKKMSTIYDMTYGTTYWVDGNYW